MRSDDDDYGNRERARLINTLHKECDRLTAENATLRAALTKAVTWCPMCEGEGHARSGNMTTRVSMTKSSGGRSARNRFASKSANWWSPHREPSTYMN